MVVRELPRIKISGKEYVVDGRLGELRSVENPGERIRFDDLGDSKEDCLVCDAIPKEALYEFYNK